MVVECVECGRRMIEDNISDCEICGAVLCVDCARLDRHNRRVCSGCMGGANEDETQ